MTESAISRLEQILEKWPGRLRSVSDETASIRPGAGKWSNKEIIGHLVDSASNNHQRFVRMQIENNLKLMKYRQDEWVFIQQYTDRNWEELITLWEAYNRHLLHVMKVMDRNTLTHSAEIGDYGNLTLGFLVADYVDHLEHHLNQISL